MEQIQVPKFIKKLKDILEKENKEIISWGNNNISFEIHDIHRFENEILPKYFKSNKIKSFQRQLNYFKFKKITKKYSKICTYYNTNFNRYNDNFLIFLDKVYNYKKKGIRNTTVNLYTYN